MERTSIMERTTIYSLAMLAGSLGAVITFLFHPTGEDLLHRSSEAASHSEMITTATHALAIFSSPVLFFGFTGFSRRLGLARPLITAALIAYGFALLAGATAAVINGIVGPSITRQILMADDSTRSVLKIVFMNNTLMNQAFDKIFLIAAAIAIVCWSVAIIRRSVMGTVIGIMGIAIGSITVLGLFTGVFTTNLKGFGLSVAAQVLWTICIAVFLFRLGPDSSVPNTVPSDE